MYNIKLTLFKSIDDWTPDGAQCNIRDIDSWKTVIDIPNMDALRPAIDKWLNGYGMEFDKFGRFDMSNDDNKSKTKRFTFSQIENGEGYPDEQGKYLADYDLYVTVREINEVECPDFGLPEL